jgi:DNA-directed RNA polymerase subunit H (RpoH/RPB5)
MSSHKSYLKQIYISRLNLINYLENNGYTCDQFKNFSIEEIEVMKKYNQLNFKVFNPDTQENCYVLYKLDDEFNQNVLKSRNIDETIRDIFDDQALIGKNDVLVIVTTDYSQESIHKYLKNLWENEKKFIVLLTLAKLQFNILSHTLVPKHIKLIQSEKDEFYKKFNIQQDNQIPEISRFDAVAKIIFLKPGEVCKIIRYDKISLKNEYYRICVS